MAELRICNHTDLVIDFVAGIKHEQDEREAKLSESIED